MENYNDIIFSARDLLSQDQEWIKRYKGYAEKIMDEKHRTLLTEARHKFNVPKPFKLYLSLTMAKKATKNHAEFELRFHGQSVGIIHVKKDGIYLVPKKISKAMITAAQSVDLDLCFAAAETKWDSGTAKIFRKNYAVFEDILLHDPSLRKAIHQPEHDMESELLGNYSLKSSTGKEITGIQPIKMAGIDARFQMPTPFRASDAKKGKVSYSGFSGGGIDILARIGHGGPSTRLAVLELKDENTKSEPPEKAIKEGIVYAVFIRELLRREQAGSNDWWKFFGFKRGIPKRLIFKVIIVMPNKDNAAKDFAKLKLPVDQNDSAGDVIELEYIYREASGLLLETSL